MPFTEPRAPAHFLTKKRVLVLLAAFAGVILLAGLLGFFAAPLLIERMIRTRLSVVMGHEVTVGAVRVDPLSLTVTIRDLEVAGERAGEPMLALEEVRLNVEASSLAHLALVVEELTVAKPRLRMVRGEDGTIDLLRLLGEDREGGGMPRFSIGKIRVRGGSVVLEDRLARETHILSELDIDVTRLSNLPPDGKGFTDLNLSADWEGCGLTLTGKSKPFLQSRETELDITFGKLDLSRYARYFPESLPFSVPAAHLGGDFSMAYRSTGEGKGGLLLSGTVKLEEVEVRDLEGLPLLKLAEGRVTLRSVDLFGGRAELASVVLRKPEAWLRRGRGGGFRLPESGKYGKKRERPFNAKVEELRVEQGAFHFRDEATPTPFQEDLTEVEGSLSGLSSSPGSRAAFDLSVRDDSGGRVRYAGSLMTSPFEVEGDLTFTGLDPARFEPYWEGHADLDISSCRVDGSAHFTVDGSGDGGAAFRVADGSLDIAGLRCRFGKGDFRGVSVLRAELEGARLDTDARILDLASVSLHGPEARFERRREGKPGAKESGDGREKNRGAFVYTVGNLHVENGAFQFRDETTPTPFQVDLSGVEGTLSGLSTIPGSRAGFDVVVREEPGGEVRYRGSLIPEPFEVQGDLTVLGLKPERFQPYWEGRTSLDLSGGTVGGSARLAVDASRGAGAVVSVEDATLEITDLRAGTGNGTPEALFVEAARLEGAKLDTGSGLLDLGIVGIHGGALKIPTSGLELSVRGGPDPPVEEGAGSKTGFTTSFRKATVEDFAIGLEGLIGKQNSSLQFVIPGATVEDFSTALGHRMLLEADLRSPSGASARFSGPLTLRPLDADLEVVVRDLDAAQVAGLLSGRFTGKVTSGTLWSEGTVVLRKPEGAPLEAVFDGTAGLADFRALDSDGENLLSLGSLEIKGVRFRSSPMRFGIGDMALVDPEIRLRIDEEGVLNLRRAWVAEPEGIEGGRTGRIETGDITFRGGTLHFEDRSLERGFFTKATGIEGSYTTSMGAPDRVSRLVVTSTVDGSADLTLTGLFHGLENPPSADLALGLRGMDLTSATAYSERYLGYALQRGRLTLDGVYRLEGKALTGENAVVLDKLSFGERVDSPYALNLPVKRAVKFLEKRDGVLHLDLPIRGNLDDPEFHYRNILMKLTMMIVLRAADPRYLFLDRLRARRFLRPREKSAFAAFAPESSTLAPGEEGRILGLIDTVRQDPRMWIELIGHADPTADGGGKEMYGKEERFELERLARERARTVRDLLAGPGGIPSERLFLVAPVIGLGREGRKAEIPPSPYVEIRLRESTITFQRPQLP